MSDRYEYFLVTYPGGTSQLSDTLWRRVGDTWEYLSFIDWQWHPVVPGTGPSAPPPEWTRPIDAEEALALAADRQHWVRYWAWHLDPASSSDDKPRTVVRRRNSPERILDEVYTFENRWKYTPGLVEAENPGRHSSPPHLVPIDRPAAERILQEVRGVEGATEL
jgi:hypothetical protein